MEHNLEPEWPQTHGLPGFKLLTGSHGRRKRAQLLRSLQGSWEVTAVHLPASPLISSPRPWDMRSLFCHAVILYLYWIIPFSSSPLSSDTITSSNAFPKPASKGSECSSTCLPRILSPPSTSHSSRHLPQWMVNNHVLPWLPPPLGWKSLEANTTSELPLYSTPSPESGVLVVTCVCWIDVGMNEWMNGKGIGYSGTNERKNTQLGPMMGQLTM